MWTTSILLCGILATLQGSRAEGILKQLKVKPHSIQDFCVSMPDWILVAHPTQCRKFYACLNHKSHGFECAEDFHFNRIELRCMPGDCARDTPQQSKCKAFEIKAVENECQKYDVCKNGKFETRICRKGHYFDSVLKICRTAANTPDGKCRCGLPEHSIFANAADCETYYRCVDGKAQLVQCPKGNYFDEQIKSCLPDLDAVCMQLPTMPPVVNAVEEKPICTNLKKGAIFHAVADDCTKFHICIAGVMLTKQCRAGFYFNAELLYCMRDKEQKCIKQQPQKVTEKLEESEVEEDSEEEDSEEEDIDEDDEDDVEILLIEYDPNSKKPIAQTEEDLSQEEEKDEKKTDDVKINNNHHVLAPHPPPPHAKTTLATPPTIGSIFEDIKATIAALLPTHVVQLTATEAKGRLPENFDKLSSKFNKF